MSYLTEKCNTLVELGLTNYDALKSYLTMETHGITDKEKKENKIDRLSRTLLSNFYDGDKTYVGKVDHTGQSYYNIIKNKYGNANLYAETIISEVGKRGMRELLDNDMLTVCGKVKGNPIYTLKERVN